MFRLTRKQSAFIVSLCTLILAYLGQDIAPIGLQTSSSQGAVKQNTPQATLTTTEHAVVSRVIDGDTVELSTGERVRYIGVDTPELHARDGSGIECFAGESAQRNVELVFQKEVTLVRDVSNTDRYGRLLRYVYVGDLFVNKQLATEGYAIAKEYPPDTHKHLELQEAMKAARTEKRGRWSVCPSN